MARYLATIYKVGTKMWSKTASIFLVGACLGIAQTFPAPGSSSTLSTGPNTVHPAPVTAQITSADPQNSTPPPAVGSTKCAPGPAWLCISQVMQRLMFNQDGTHRPDAEIAAAAPRAIADLIKDGTMKPENAPATPILTFDDANKFVSGYPSGATETAPTAPAAPPAKTDACPPDQPWLCPAQAGPPRTPAPSAGGAANAPKSGGSSGGTMKAAAPSSKGSAATKGAAAPPAATGARPTHPDTAPYVLGPNDVVQVTVFDEKMVPGTYPIGPDGRISMPLLGTFKAIDMTVTELKDLLTEKLKDQGGILDPIVNVQLLRSNSKQFTLVGGVGRTGPQQLVRDTTILDALSAVGFRDFAKTKKIVLRRANQEFKFNYQEVIKGKNLAQNIFIEDGDLIYVPE